MFPHAAHVVPASLQDMISSLMIDDIRNSTVIKRQDFFERFEYISGTGRPKYARLREMMIEAIKSGYWRPGIKLPTELELTEATPFSLGTVQRALRDLAEEGIVIRRQGLGTFVAPPPKPLQDPWHCRFVDTSGERMLPVFSKTLARQRIIGRGPWSRHLSNAANGVVRIDRKIFINNEFSVFSRFYTDPKLLPPFAKYPLKKLNGTNFMSLIADKCGLPITQLTQDVVTAKFDADVAEIIGVEPQSSGLYIQAVAYAGAGTCMYYQELFVPPTDRPLRFSEILGTPDAILRSSARSPARSSDS